jgi:hypothetical protein
MGTPEEEVEEIGLDMDVNVIDDFAEGLQNVVSATRKNPIYIEKVHLLLSFSSFFSFTP